MSRGRGTAGKRASAAPPTRRAVSLPPDLLVHSSEEIEQRALKDFAELELIKPKPSDDHRPRLQARLRLGEMVGQRFAWALEDGEWQWAKRCLAEYHLRSDNESAAVAAMSCDDQHMRAAASVMRMLPHWRRIRAIATLPALEMGTLSAEKDLLAKAHMMEPLRDQIIRYVKERERARLRWQSPARKDFNRVTHSSLAQARRSARKIISEFPGDGPVAVRVEVTPEVLIQFCRSHQGDEAYSGLLSSIGELRRGKRTLYASASFEAVVKGRPLRLQMTTKLLETTSDRIAHYRRKVGDFAASQGAQDLVRNNSGRRLRLEGRDGRSYDPGDRGLLVRSATAMLGSDYCPHRNSEWKSNEVETWLSCDDCMVGCLARIPLHQLPANSSPPEGIDERAYLDHRRFLDEVYVRPQDPATSWAELRARDGVIAASAHLYITGESPRGVSGRRVRRVSDAMNRR